MAALALDRLLNTATEAAYSTAGAMVSDSMRPNGAASNAVLCRIFLIDDCSDLCSANGDDADLAKTSTNAEELAQAEAAIERTSPQPRVFRASPRGTRSRPAEGAIKLPPRATA